MSPEEFKKRTQKFAVRIIRVAGQLPKTTAATVMGRQLLRCGTSVGANYRAACRARSHADFIAKLGIVEEECDESMYWMELLIESGAMKPKRLSLLMNEASEILRMVVQSINTSRRAKKSAIRNPQSAMSAPQSAIRNPQSAMPAPQSAIRNPQSAMPAPQSAIRNPQSAIP
jgi:four helix bundle protein